ncbi:DNA helicase PIF1-like protein, partial [Tanacetum coccineum]
NFQSHILEEIKKKHTLGRMPHLVEMQKKKIWNACLDMKFIDIVVKLGGSQAATPKKIKQHMKDDDITLSELQSHLQAFRLATKTVDQFVNTKQPPTLVDTEDWTSKMLYYFKSRWEEEERQKKPTNNDVAVEKIIESTVQNDTNMKRRTKSLDKKFIDIVVKLGGCQAATPEKIKEHMKEHDITILELQSNLQKYTTWPIEMCKKFIDVMLELGGSQDATPNTITEHMKDDNVTLSEVQNHLKGSEKSTPAEYKGISKVYMDIGDPIQTCHACQAKLWTGETNKKQITKKISFTMCCKKGQVLLPKMEDPPKDLLDLFTANDATSKYFIHNIRKFNSIFSFTSIGGKVDKTVNNGRGPWIYRMQGENYHLMPSLGPKENDIPKFSQLYIFDNQNELHNRFTALR